jgi:hypothetical protein
MKGRVAVFVDIQGFSYIYLNDKPDSAMWLLHLLMEDLNKLRLGERMGIHQVGDGFILVSWGVDVNQAETSKYIAFSIALLRSMTLNGGCIKCSVSYGDFADVQGMYPKGVKDQGFGKGIMTTASVMGTALIRAYDCGKLASGPLLLVDKDIQAFIPKEGLITRVFNHHIEIDWIHSDFEPVLDIHQRIQRPHTGTNNYEDHLNSYLSTNPNLPDRWVRGALRVLSGYKTSMEG